MLKAKTFVKKTKRGNIIKVVREHYLRDDLSCGSLLCGVCPNLSPAKLCVKQNAESSIVPKPHYLVIDTNVALHQVISTAIRQNKSFDRSFLSSCENFKRFCFVQRSFCYSQTLITLFSDRFPRRSQHH